MEIYIHGDIYTWGISIETNMYMDVTPGYKYCGLEYWCENCIELQSIRLFIGPRKGFKNHVTKSAKSWPDK